MNHEEAVISLEEVRRRHQRQAQEKSAAAERAEQCRRHAEALGVLHAVLAEGRMDPAVLSDMIKLGIVTDDEARLPCASRSRVHSYPDWEVLYYGHAEAPPDPGTVCCPLLAFHAREMLPPCSVALSGRSAVLWDQVGERPIIQPVPPDPDDPVMRADLRPCVVLGREAYVTIMGPVWQREEQPE